MRYARLGDTYLVRLEKGEEIVAAVADFAADRRIDAAGVTGLGAAYDVVLGYYDLASREYSRRTIADHMEIVSLTGNIVVQDGRALPHLHAVLSGRDCQTVGGHLFEGKVGGTCELIVRPLPGYVQRVRNDEVGLYLLDV